MPEEFEPGIGGGIAQAAGGAIGGAAAGSVFGPVGAIVGGALGLFGSILNIGAASEQDELNRRIAGMNADLLERDAAHLGEVSSQRADDILAQSRERAGDYRRQGDWRVSDIMRNTGMQAGSAAAAYSRSGVQLGGGSAGARVRQIRGQGGLVARREGWLANENAQRTERWGNISAQRLRENAAFQQKRMLGQAAIARLGGDSPSSVPGAVIQGANTVVRHGANILDAGQRHGWWDLS